jgi:hypothetical protein
MRECRRKNAELGGGWRHLGGVRRGQATESTQTTEGRGRHGSVCEASVRIRGEG